MQTEQHNQKESSGCTSIPFEQSDVSSEPRTLLAKFDYIVTQNSAAKVSLQ